MTVTLTCAYCERRETQEQPWHFPGWYKILEEDGCLQGNDVCSEECGASWLMRRQLERERVAP